MIRLENNGLAAALEQYRSSAFFFPLIGAVLSQSQDGVVFCDDLENPEQFYIQHRSGFAQIFGRSNAGFEQALARRLLIDRDGEVAKVRLYLPDIPAAIAAIDMAPFQSERQRFHLRPVLAGAHTRRKAMDDLEIRPAGQHDVEQLEATFGIVTRFWRSPDDFIAYAQPIVAVENGAVVSVCCAAAVAAQQAEIDVATATTHRGKAFGQMVVSAFVDRCRNAGIEPLWDCFTNNLPSMRTAAATGFVAVGKPYPFLTIPQNIS